MKYRHDQKADLDVSELGIGFAYLHESSEEEIIETIHCALEHGINYFDLVASNDKALKAFGKAIQGQREKAILQVHFGATYPHGEYNWCRNLKEIKAEYRRMMGILGTDYIDNGFIQCVDDEEDFRDLTRPGGLLDFMKGLKEKGVIHHLGFSSHNPKIANLFLDLGCMDIFMFSINPSYDYQIGEYALGETAERAKLYIRAAKEGVGITVMKPLGGGQLLDPQRSPFGVALTPKQCFAYALDKPGVLCVLPGIKNKTQLLDILSFEEATPEEKDYSCIQNFTRNKKGATCVYCNHCHPCPVGINIGLVNKYYDLALLGDEVAKGHYDKLPLHASDCIRCGHCDSRCPFHVKQSLRMKEIASYFGK